MRRSEWAEQVEWERSMDRLIAAVQRANAIRGGAGERDSTDPERAALDDRVQAFMADTGEADYAAALAMVLDQSEQPREAPDGVDRRRFDLHQRVLDHSIEHEVDYHTALDRVLDET